ncbi:MAG: MBL fold metallo-hydrolase [Desulfobacteraceae bacterium]|jgi:ribonuclease Z
MSKLKVTFLIILLVLLSAFAIGYFTFDLDRFLYRVAKKELEKDTHDSLQRDGIEILLIGTGSPRHAKNRGQSCLGVIAAGQFMLFDAGQGCMGRLAEMEAPLVQISVVFLTHLHSDHMSGLGEVINNTWVMGRSNKIHVHGPPGTRALLSGFAEIYKEDIEDRVARRGKDDLDSSLAVAEPHIVTVNDKEAHTVYEKNGLVVKAFLVEHPEWKYAYGYRIEYAGRVLVVSGDTRFSKQVIRHAKGADILIHEAFNKRMLDAAQRAADDLKIKLSAKAIREIKRTHTSTLEAAKVAKEAGVDKLVLTHIIPPLPNIITEKIFVLGMDEIYKGDIILAADGMRLLLPDHK